MKRILSALVLCLAMVSVGVAGETKPTATNTVQAPVTSVSKPVAKKKVKKAKKAVKPVQKPISSVKGAKTVTKK